MLQCAPFCTLFTLNSSFCLCRMIDWLSWPLAQHVDTWVIALLKGLAAVQKFTILIDVTLLKIELVCSRTLRLSLLLTPEIDYTFYASFKFLQMLNYSNNLARLWLLFLNILYLSLVKKKKSLTRIVKAFQ